MLKIRFKNFSPRQPAVVIGISILLLLITTVIAFALPNSNTIDGDPSDWSDATCTIDPGGADDETDPLRADITQFCIHLDDSFLYIFMAWDDTLPEDGDSTAGVRVDITGNGTYDFIILDTITDSGGSLSAGQVRIDTCDDDGDCGNGDLTCDDGGTPTCSSQGVLEDADDESPDPFSHTGNVCDGTDCLDDDAFVEIAIPWDVLDIDDPPDPQTFGNFGSFPSGPAQNPEDGTGTDGISCLPNGTCFPSTPTAITLINLTARSESGNLRNGTLFIALLLAVAAGAIFIALRKRSAPALTPNDD
jgi:hypothetical protein